MDEASVFERFLSLAKRELGAEDVRLIDQAEAAPEAPNVVVARLPDGRHVVASFPSAPNEAEVLSRRLAMLASTFAEALANPPSERTRARPHVVSSLHEELKALAARARATDVVVIDVDSPVVWASASVRARPRAPSEVILRDVSERELSGAPTESDESQEPLSQDVLAPVESSPVGVSERREGSHPVIRRGSGAPAALEDDEERDLEPELTRRAIGAVRRLPTLDQLHKGRHLRHVSTEAPWYLVVSFSGIYVLCLVFDDAFDELRAERAAHESLPRVERLVLALPPLDPEPQPMGGVISFPRARRR